MWVGAEREGAAISPEQGTNVAVDVAYSHDAIRSRIEIRSVKVRDGPLFVFVRYAVCQESVEKSLGC